MSGPDVDLGAEHVERGAMALHGAYSGVYPNSQSWDGCVQGAYRAEARAAISAGAVWPAPVPPQSAVDAALAKMDCAWADYRHDVSGGGQAYRESVHACLRALAAAVKASQ